MNMKATSYFLLLVTSLVHFCNSEKCTNDYGKPDIKDLKKVVCEMFPQFWWFNCQEGPSRSSSNPIREYCEKTVNDPFCCTIFEDLEWCQPSTPSPLYVRSSTPPTAKGVTRKRFCQRYPYHSICQFKPTPVPPVTPTADPRSIFCNKYPNYYLPECRDYHQGTSSGNQVTATPTYDVNPLSGKTCQCVPRWQCSSNDVSNLARLSQCGGDYSTICCPLEFLSTDALNTATNSGYTSCGLKGNKGKDGNQISVARFARILDTNYAEFGEYPWQAAVLFSNYTYNCGGALIHRQWVVTAAHCAKTLTEADLLVRLGEYDTETDAEPPYQEYGIQKIVFHPGFNKETLANDIALLKLKSPAQLNSYVNVICLTPDTDFTGQNCTVTGWGRDSPKGYFSSVLKEVEVPIVSNDVCQQLYRQSELGPYYQLDNSFTCAGTRGKDACEGDGGSPLVCEKDGTYRLAGIVSWGISCGGDYPGVYARIPSMVSWIQQVMYNKIQY